MFVTASHHDENNCLPLNYAGEIITGLWIAHAERCQAGRNSTSCSNRKSLPNLFALDASDGMTLVFAEPRPTFRGPAPRALFAGTCAGPAQVAQVVVDVRKTCWERVFAADEDRRLMSFQVVEVRRWASAMMPCCWRATSTAPRHRLSQVPLIEQQQFDDVSGQRDVLDFRMCWWSRRRKPPHSRLTATKTYGIRRTLPFTSCSRYAADARHHPLNPATSRLAPSIPAESEHHAGLPPVSPAFSDLRNHADGTVIGAIIASLA